MCSTAPFRLDEGLPEGDNTGKPTLCFRSQSHKAQEVKVDGDPDHLGARARRPMKSRDGKLAAVRGLTLFSSVSADDVRRIGRLMELARVTSGAVLCLAGEPCREFVLVVNGHLVAQPEHGPTISLRPGDHVGAAEIIDGARMAATVRVATDSTVLIAGRRQFDALIAQVEPFRRAIFTDLARQARERRATPWTVAPLPRLAWN